MYRRFYWELNGDTEPFGPFKINEGIVSSLCNFFNAFMEHFSVLKLPLMKHHSVIGVSDTSQLVYMIRIVGDVCQ
jgi:hypothetical protein